MKRILCLLVLAACAPSERLPEGVLDRERFTRVLAGATLIEARISQEMSVAPAYPPPVGAYYEELFREHGIDSATFRASFDHYAQRPLEMKAIYEDIVERLRLMKDQGLQAEALMNAAALATDSSSERN
ncbi:MAG: DUF4296 domain-containing protein [Flavobacteriales bacterium]